VSILVDTPIWSFALRRRPRQLSAAQRACTSALRDLIVGGRVLAPGPIRQEILSGLRDAATFERLREYLRDFDDAPVTLEDYEEAARCRNRCAAAGVACSAVDMLLCALSLRLDVPIFTTDPDFMRYARVLHLHVVNVEQVNAALRKAKKPDENKP
jgi:hypothetical protein